MSDEQREVWRIVDSRTDRPVSILSWPTKELADRTIAGWVERDKRGKRPDVSESIPYLTARLRKDTDW